MIAWSQQKYYRSLCILNGAFVDFCVLPLNQKQPFDTKYIDGMQVYQDTAESTKTTSKKDVSTRVLEKIKNI